MAEQTVRHDVGISAELSDVQRLIVSAYAHLPWARYLLLRTDDTQADMAAVRSWIGSLVPRLSNAAVKPDDVGLNLALTAEGLQRLGVEQEVMASFSRAFRQGMAGEYRARLLGDVGPAAPERWLWGGPGQTPHFLIALYTQTPEGLVETAKGIEADAGRAGVHVAFQLDSVFLPNAMEHFGFTDGVSQPVLAGTEWAQRTPAPKWESIAPGEFVLGHTDESGFPAEGPKAGDLDLGRNGTYLVMRQIEQHVERFREYVDKVAAKRGVDPEDLAARMVGRRRDGTPLALGAPPAMGPDDLNNFGYEHDVEGLGCPLGAHVRRANPRNATAKGGAAAAEVARLSANRHRILRRGRPYGPADDARKGDEPRGLVFVALNADIERQFEFVQHTWLNNSTFAGLHGEIDPITAEQPTDDGMPMGSFSKPARPVRHRLSGIPSFTTTVGGGYFFLPGIRALDAIARGIV